MNKVDDNRTNAVRKETVGIDLGTTNSCIAIIQDGNIKVLENGEGLRTTPSVVAFDKNGKILVGGPAQRKIGISDSKVFSSIKRKMGQKVSFKVGDKEWTPEEISAQILVNLVKSAEEKLGKKINSAVITVPADFDDAQRNATINAGKIAGLNVERIINEPTAAALAYGLDKIKKDQKVFVYDLGGGTFDVSIVHISDGVIEVIASSGIGTLGGNDYDLRIFNHVVEDFKKTHGVDPSKDEGSKKRILEACQKAKHELSFNSQVLINVPFVSDALHLESEITRSEFEKITKDLTDKTVNEIRSLLKSKNLKASDIDQVLLVGGSTRMPIIAEIIKKELGKTPNKEVNPDEVVAIGAAIQGAILAGDIKDVLLLDVTPLSLGIETEGSVNTILIPRNSTIPTSKSQVFSTAVDNQPSVTILVIQGERPNSRDNKVIGSFELSGIDKAPRGVPQIEVTFSVDANGVVSVAAKDLKTNKEKSITIRDSQGLSKEEIDRMIKEAEENKAKDEETRSNLESLNRAQGYIYNFDKQIEELKNKPDFNPEDPQFKSFEEMCNSLKKSVEEKDYTSIRDQLSKIEELMKMSEELMEKNKNSNSNDENNSSSSDGSSQDDINSNDSDVDIV